MAVSDSIQYLDQHAGVIALLALVVAWLVYRIDRWATRGGVIRGLAAELAMHGGWVSNQYGENSRGSWPASHVVYKLSTVAIDDAIIRGPSLFLNRDLDVTLVRYRQVVSHLNQLIESHMAFLANPGLYSAHPPAELVARAIRLVEVVHIEGIGVASAEHPAAYVFYSQVTFQLSRERDSKVLPLIWLVTGINLFALKRLGKWI